MIKRSLIAAALLLAAAGCERGTWAIEGQAAVTQSDDDESPPRGIAQASVTLRCGKHTQTVHADRAGAFELHGKGLGPTMDCVIEITAPGHEAWSAALRDVCADDDDDDHCEHATVLATLEKKRVPTAAK